MIKRVAFLEGRAVSIGRNLPFHPIVDLLKHWARIREDDGETIAFEKLEAAVKNVCQEEVKEVLPFVATLMGMKLFGRYAERVKGIEGEALEKLILKNLRDLLSKATERTPLVIVVEDLHWADTSTIELMGSLFRLAEKQGILFVNVFRPGYTATGERIVETIKDTFPAYYVEIAIKPLDEKLGEMLISNMMNITGLHYSVIDQIVKRADGNPFFIEEVVRSFIDQGVIREWSKYDLTKIERGAATFSALSSIFFYSGISFRLSRKILKSFKSKIDTSDVTSKLVYEFFTLMHNFLAGNWDMLEEYDDDLINKNLSMGEFFNVHVYLVIHGIINRERGRFDETQGMIDKLFEIANTYEYDTARRAAIFHEVSLLAKYGRIYQALSRVEDATATHKEIGWGMYIFWIYAYAAQIQIVQGGIGEAEEALKHARTYFEVGKRVLEEKSKYKELNGIKAEEYLAKAKTMFEEMDLQWDLDQLERIAAQR